MESLLEGRSKIEKLCINSFFRKFGYKIKKSPNLSRFSDIEDDNISVMSNEPHQNSEANAHDSLGIQTEPRRETSSRMEIRDVDSERYF